MRNIPTVELILRGISDPSERSLPKSEDVDRYPNHAVKLARALQGLRESIWPDQELSQAQLAKALSSEGRVAAATLRSWESLTNSKTLSPDLQDPSPRLHELSPNLDGDQ